MRREKTGREVLGTRLFADPALLARYLQQLPVDAANDLRQAIKDRPGAPSDQLRADLHSSLGLRPLEIHDLLAIRIETARRDYLNEYRVVTSGYLADATVPYSGSALFWKALPHNGFEFGFPGRIGPSSASIRTFMDGKDYDWFEQHVETELAAARKALNAHADEIIRLQTLASEMVDRVADDILGQRC